VTLAGRLTLFFAGIAVATSGAIGTARTLPDFGVVSLPAA